MDKRPIFDPSPYYPGQQMSSTAPGGLAPIVPPDLAAIRAASPHELTGDFIRENAGLIHNMLQALLATRPHQMQMESEFMARHGLGMRLYYGYDEKHALVIMRAAE